MKITWFGHAAFAVEGRDESGEMRKVILDPYNYPLAGGYLRGFRFPLPCAGGRML